MIKRDNYELWFLDYAEGKLDDSGQLKVHAFLALNPDLQEEFNLLTEGVLMLEAETTDLFPKAGLRKKINPVGCIDETNYQTFFIAAQEGDLTTNETNELNLFLAQHAFLKAEFESFSRLKLIPGNEYYPHKKALKHYPVIPLFIRFSAAASIIFFIGLATWRFFYTDVETSSAMAFQKYGVEIPALEPSVQQWVNSELPKTGVSEHAQTHQLPELRQVRSALEIVQHDAAKTELIKTALEPGNLAQSELLYVPDSEPDDALSIAQVFGKVLENGLGKNGISKRLIRKQKITPADFADVASVPFKNSENPILAIGPESSDSKRKMKINLGGFFEAEFAVKK